MKRTLLAFGDSHTAGAEILERYSYECFDRSYAAYVANYYKFDYKNFSQAGCGNDWLIHRFNKEIKSAIKNKEDVFVLFNFCESSRMFFEDKGDLTVHFYPSLLDKKYYKEVENSFIKKGEEDTDFFKDLKRLLPVYEDYLRDNTLESLDLKSLTQVQYIQKICIENNIPFVFHSSCQWYSGSWDDILEQNYYGHNKKFNFNFSYSNYSFWGRATTNERWKHLQKEHRWSEHYPEEYHRHYASLLINFINNQGIL